MQELNTDFEQKLEHQGVIDPEQYQKERAENDFSKDIELVKSEYSRLGDLRLKLQGVKDRGVKEDIRKKHAYDLKAVKTKVAILKSKIAETKDIKAEQKVLTWERQRNIIGRKDEYKLNRMEFDALPYSCECYYDAPSDYEATVGKEYKHIHYFDEGRQKEMYITWIEYEIAPESQITPELDWKIKQGFMPEQKDYPSPRKEVRRRVLVESEWKKYFREL